MEGQVVRPPVTKAGLQWLSWNRRSISYICIWACLNPVPLHSWVLEGLPVPKSTLQLFRAKQENVFSSGWNSSGCGSADWTVPIPTEWKKTWSLYFVTPQTKQSKLTSLKVESMLTLHHNSQTGRLFCTKLWIGIDRSWMEIQSLDSD